jgi:hypothetical protein
MSYRPFATGARWGYQRRIARWAGLAGLSGLIGISVPVTVRGQGASVGDGSDTSGALSGALVGLEDGQPIAYATVTLVGFARASFADGNGAFRLTRIVPGSYVLRVRQIGYAPLDTTVAVAAGPEVTTLSLRLRRIALKLAGVAIEGRRSKGCVATGIPDSAVNGTLATIFAQVRENVDRVRLLLDEYPFRFSREERHLRRFEPGGDSTVSVDTADYESRARRPYRVGGIIYVQYDALGRRRRYMYLPVFRDLADPAFLSAHCFVYGGSGRLGGSNGAQIIRVDFRPADTIKGPDVEGSIYLDAQRFVVRRAVFRMTKPQAADPPLIALSVTTTFRELVSLVPVFDSVESDQLFPAVVGSRPAGLGGTQQAIKQTAVEDDRLLDFAFEHRAPGQQGPSESAAARSATSASGVAGGSAPGRMPALVGRVVQSDGTPVVGATVALIGTHDTVSTSDSGGFAFADAPQGAHMLSVRQLGFASARIPVTIARDRPRPVTVTLVRAIPVLPTVVTAAQMHAAMQEVGLDQRMRAGQGQYLTYDQIQRRQANKLSQLLNGIRGIQVWQNPLEFETTVQGTRGVGSCVAFVIDGVPQAVTSNHDVDNLINPSAIAAVEIYSSAERPTGLGGLEERPPPGLQSSTGLHAGPGSGPAKDTTFQVVDLNAQQCTLVVIWTRARLGLPEGSTPGAATALSETHGRPVLPNASMCEIKPADDTIDVAMYATLQGDRGPTTSDTSWARYVDRVLAGLRATFVMPSDLPMPVFGYPFPQPSVTRLKGPSVSTVPVLSVAPALSSVIVFVLDSAGAVRSARVAASSLSGPADTSLLAAIMEAGATHAFPVAPSTEHGGDLVRFDLVVSTAQPAPGGRAAILGRLAVPTWILRRRVSLADGPQPSLAPDETAAMTSDSARLEFVVDDAGRVATSTVRAVSASGAAAGQSERGFLARLIRALPKFQFQPALIGACPVPQIVTQDFAYRQR